MADEGRQKGSLGYHVDVIRVDRHQSADDDIDDDAEKLDMVTHHRAGLKRSFISSLIISDAVPNPPDGFFVLRMGV
jgi:hypothetical protein